MKKKTLRSLLSKLFRFNAPSLSAYSAAGLLYWLSGFFSAVSMWTGGQQSRLPVPAGTPTAGLHQSPLPARPHLDRASAHLYPWVLFIKFFLPCSHVTFLLPLQHLVTACPHYLLTHSNPPQSTSFHVLLVCLKVRTHLTFAHSDLMWINITGGETLPRPGSQPGSSSRLCWRSAPAHSFSLLVLCRNNFWSAK